MLLCSSILCYSSPLRRHNLTDSDSQYASEGPEARRKRCQKYHVDKPAGHQLRLDFNGGNIIQVGIPRVCLIYMRCKCCRISNKCNNT